MGTARWKEVRALLEGALEEPRSDREAFVRSKAAHDADLAREVLALLATEEDSKRIESVHAPFPTAQGLPARIGGYRIVRELGAGGMGTVYEAEQENPRRRVALKVMRQGFASAEERSRFRYEAEVLARLAHPAIAQVHEAGVHSEPGGALELPFFALEYVEGARSITEYARSQRLDRDARIELFLHACDAVQHGHAKGVIHRDLKPANILVDRAGRVKVIDFGIARSVEQDPGARSMATRTGSLLGTPLYMSPEQLAGDVGAIDVRTDVYALGVVLYELLCDRPPFDVEGRPLPMLLRALAEETIVRPSTRDPALAGDLEWIVLKALERERERRYAGVSELAADLRRHRTHEPVLAGPPSASYRLRKFVRRHRGSVLAGALLVLALVAGVVGTTIAMLDAEEARADAQAKQLAAEEGERKVLRLSDVRRLADLVEEARRLWPARPERAPELEAWLGRAGALVENLPVHRAALAELRAFGQLVASADGSVSAWSFASTEDAWQEQVLRQLVGDLEALSAPDSGLVASVARRLEFARTIAERSVEGPAARALWEGASASIRDAVQCPLYAGLALGPQLGLLPLGRDPRTGLWEFAHLQTGAPATRNASGDLAIEAATGFVLVLVPGGRFHLGAQRDDPSSPNHDAQAGPREEPVVEAELAPYFLSKYEMTQGQWLRARGTNPSWYSPANPLEVHVLDLTHPVEQVSWLDCATVLRELDLELPTEAQWERAARGGTESAWWTGTEKETLDGAANLCDRFARRHIPEDWRFELWLDDGYVCHAPVGTFRANPFGFHEITGNLAEWCRDEMLPCDAPRAAIDGLRTGQGTGPRVVRDGNYLEPADHARAAFRVGAVATQAMNTIGVRPARRIER